VHTHRKEWPKLLGLSGNPPFLVTGQRLKELKGFLGSFLSPFIQRAAVKHHIAVT